LLELDDRLQTPRVPLHDSAWSGSGDAHRNTSGNTPHPAREL